MQRLNRIFAFVLAAAPVLLLALFLGCAPETEFSGAPLLNAMPDTRITGTPPVLRQTDFTVRFFWTGNDPDGRVKGFQWKMTTNGLDGISVRDTLTYDPATGDTLNPWIFTEVTDTTFVVSADSSGFPLDDNLGLRDARFYQYHTLFVRAIDEDGAVDPTPAFVTFTATTLAPSIRVSSPANISTETWKGVPPSASFGWTGTDPDFELGVPIKVRYMMKQIPYESAATTRDSLYSLTKDSDPLWSDWLPYLADEEERRVTFSQIPAKEAGEWLYYIFAIQAQDTAGARNLDRNYQRNVVHFRIKEEVAPTIEVCDQFLGCRKSSKLGLAYAYDIAQGQPLNFRWSANASWYGGVLEAFRYGWDVTDPDNDEDDGWQVSWGLSALHREAEEKSFASGQHTLLVQSIDNSGLKSSIEIVLNVVPVPEPSSQGPLLLVDDVPDKTSNAWPSRSGEALDRDEQRDNFWEEVLSLSGGVSGFSWDLDMVDTEEFSQFGYREAVNYRNIMWTTKLASTTFLHSEFDPSSDLSTKFIWLAPYQQSVGNLMLFGSGALTNFHQKAVFQQGTDPEDGSPIYSSESWAWPVIYDTSDGRYQTPNGTMYAIGFGMAEDIDGNEYRVGPGQYPYDSIGISVLDQLEPTIIYPSSVGATTRRRNCVGTKAIFVDPDFKMNYVDAGAFPDTIFHDLDIDWKDHSPAYQDEYGIPLASSTYPFASKDEFYNLMINTDRLSTWSEQTMPDGSPVVEPMFRLYARFDYITDEHIRVGDDSYPDFDTGLVCGTKALELTKRTRMAGAALGILSHRYESTKPGGRGDIVWGFDPYRFDRENIKKVIQWVMSRYYGEDAAD